MRLFWIIVGLRDPYVIDLDVGIAGTALEKRDTRACGVDGMPVFPVLGAIANRSLISNDVGQGRVERQDPDTEAIESFGVRDVLGDASAIIAYWVSGGRFIGLLR
jgi:hypothetical protein